MNTLRRRRLTGVALDVLGERRRPLQVLGGAVVLVAVVALARLGTAAAEPAAAPA